MSKTILQMCLAVVVVGIFATPTICFEDANTFEEEDKTFADDTFASSGSNCGGVIRATAAVSRLAYKPFENVLTNERCVWIVAAFLQNVNISTSYRITATYLGFPASDRHLSYATLTRSSSSISHYYPSSQGSAVTAAGHVLIVTFSTGNATSRGKGFILEIQGSEFAPAVNASSRFVILNTDAHFHRHPPNGGNYLNNELSALVLPPTSYDLDRYRTQVALIKEIQIEKTYDWIEVFLFSASTNSWIYSGRLAGVGSSNTEKIIHDDIILLAFSTDHSNVYAGFEITTLTV